MKRTYGQGCPVAHSLDLIGERWALLVVRELRLGSRPYGEIAAALPGIGPSVLSQRLRDLEAVGVVAKRGKVYRLTEWGAELEPVFRGLARWGARSPVVPLQGPVSSDSVFLGLRTFFREGDLDWTASYRFLVGVETYGLKVTDGALSELWRGRVDGVPDVTVNTDLDGLCALFDGGTGAEEAVRGGRVTVFGKVSLLRRLIDAIERPRPRSRAVPQRGDALWDLLD